MTRIFLNLLELQFDHIKALYVRYGNNSEL